MDAIEGLRQDVREGRIGAERLLDLLEMLMRRHELANQQLEATIQQLEAAQQRIAELERKMNGPSPKIDEPFSMRAEEKRQEDRRKKNRVKKKRKKKSGRVRTQDKIKQAERTEQVFPKDVPKSECRLSHTRVVWRLENGHAVLVAYEVYRGPKNQYGEIPGVLGRSEFGREIVVQLVYLIHITGLSFDKACGILHFFQDLRLSKSQADALLHQLSRHWEREFETLCTLLANSAVVHADETSWSIHSVWALLSEKARILLFGVHKDAETLKLLLDPATFAGLLVSDDAAVYGNFTQSQKCWAHLLRKAIKLTLADPKNTEYREFTDQLLAIYRKACRIQHDGRLGDAGRTRKVADLADAIFDLCVDRLRETTGLSGPAKDYRLLNHELFRLMSNDELFTFVRQSEVKQIDGTTQPVPGTNNEAERTLRDPALARRTGRTNKTASGARRQTILKSVLESLRLYVPKFTLKTVVNEIQRWTAQGVSCFETLRKKLKLELPKTGTLDRLYPKPIPTG